MSVQIVLATTEKSETLPLVPHLERQGWQVTLANTGTDALTTIDQLRPFAAFVDIHLPYMTGWDVLQRLRTSPILQSTVVILVYPVGASQEDYFRGHLLGADLTLATPFDPRHPIGLLSRILKAMQEEKHVVPK